MIADLNALHIYIRFPPRTAQLLMVEVYKVRKKRSRFGFMVRTRDWPELTLRTLPALAGEAAIDLYWIDGSANEEGMKLAREACRDLPGLCEVHAGVNYGQVRSYIYGIKQLLEEHYEYVGSIDGDVLTEPGWFQGMCNLYEAGARDGLNVGSVSARCVADRVLTQRDGYAVMANIGNGMMMMKKDVFLNVLYDPSNCVLNNIAFRYSSLCKQFREIASVNYPMLQRVREDILRIKDQPDTSIEWFMSNDWWVEVILLRQGMVALAATPSLARNIDEAGAKEVVFSNGAQEDPTFDWGAFVNRLNTLFAHHDAPARRDVAS